MLSLLPSLITPTIATVPIGAGLFGWTMVDVPMLALLPVLLVLSGFFSGSETALFALTQAERNAFRDRQVLAHRAVDALLADQRMLLITVLLGNMTINVLYFVITSVLLMHATLGVLGTTAMGVTFLFIIVVFGEVGPKMIASVARERYASVCAPVLLAFHRIIGPLRHVLNVGVIGPLSRLTAPTTAPPVLHDAELRALLDISEQSGIIDEEEQRLLHDVLRFQRLKVRDVMTPRVNMIALPANASREHVTAAARNHRLRRIPIYEGDLDHVVGILQVKTYLLEPSIASVTDPRVLSTADYVPDLVDLDRLLDQFRRQRSPIAIVVNEYGGTEGVVAAEDVVEEVVGDIVGPEEVETASPTLVAMGTWIVSGALEIDPFATAYSVSRPTTSAATVGVYVAERLGRPAEIGDAIDFGPLRLEVAALERRRVTSILVSLREDDEPVAEPAADPAPQPRQPREDDA